MRNSQRNKNKRSTNDEWVLLVLATAGTLLLLVFVVWQQLPFMD